MKGLCVFVMAKVTVVVSPVKKLYWESLDKLFSIMFLSFFRFRSAALLIKSDCFVVRSLGINYMIKKYVTVCF